MKVKKSWIVLVSIAITIIFTFVITIALRPDIRYIIGETIDQLGVTANVKKVDKGSLELIDCDLKTVMSAENLYYDYTLMLINDEYKLTKDISEFAILYGNTDVKMNHSITKDYAELVKAVKENCKEDILYISSAYEKTEDNGVEAGEHSAGLAIDVYVKDYKGKDFLKTRAGQYVNSNCWKFGFIVRYPYYGTNKTGVEYEPWHIRYVGYPHAEIMYKNKWTLEEYLDKLKVGEFYEYGGYYISKQNGNTITIPEKYSLIGISPDNTGNYILTIKQVEDVE
ncbi:MAG: D-alanyl-D-alanine carboxypeptidase family protein [Lachnospiraceae bacterium]|nr:D-alanyl-D-alanine carboxypeptidase family protein [Lachnospiraceae bacterium]